jgi:hypothetical protein
MLSAAELVRSCAPDQHGIADQADQLCEQIVSEYGRCTTVGEVVGVFAGFLRACRALGPNSQEAVRSRTEPLIEQLGLMDAITRAANSASALAGSSPAP